MGQQPQQPRRTLHIAPFTALGIPIQDLSTLGRSTKIAVQDIETLRGSREPPSHLPTNRRSNKINVPRRERAAEEPFQAVGSAELDRDPVGGSEQGAAAEPEGRGFESFPRHLVRAEAERLKKGWWIFKTMHTYPPIVLSTGAESRKPKKKPFVPVRLSRPRT